MPLLVSVVVTAAWAAPPARLPHLVREATAVVRATVADPPVRLDEVVQDCLTVPVTQYRFEVIEVLHDATGSLTEGAWEAADADVAARLALAPERCAGRRMTPSPTPLHRTGHAWVAGAEVLVFLDTDERGLSLVARDAWDHPRRRRRVQRLLERTEARSHP